MFMDLIRDAFPDIQDPVSSIQYHSGKNDCFSSIKHEALKVFTQR